MVGEGAAIIDVGGESTRPGAAPASLDEELARVMPVIEALRARIDVFISVDTSKPEVMRAAVDAGADIINDVRALRAPGALAGRGRDAGRRLPDAHAGRAAHHAGRAALRRCGRRSRAHSWPSASPRCRAAGIAAARLAIDPGFGFGKTRRRQPRAAQTSRRDSPRSASPLLVGLSRKSMLGKLTGRPVEERLRAASRWPPLRF